MASGSLGVPAVVDEGPRVTQELPGRLPLAVAGLPITGRDREVQVIEQLGCFWAAHPRPSEHPDLRSLEDPVI